MAKYNITALNYINVGSKRAFFNIDSKLNYSLNAEYRLLSVETDNSDVSSILVTESEVSAIRVLQELDTEENV